MPHRPQRRGQVERAAGDRRAGAVPRHHHGRRLAAGARSPRRRAALVAYVPQSPLMPDDMTGGEYVLLGRNPYMGYFGSETKHDRALVADVLGSARSARVRRSPARHPQRRRAAAVGHRPGRRPGSTHPVARRAHQCTRHRPPAAGVGAGRSPAPRARADGGVRDARPHPGRPLRRPAVAAAPGSRRGSRRPRRTCCGPRRSASSTASASACTTSPTAPWSSSPAANAPSLEQGEEHDGGLDGHQCVGCVRCHVQPEPWPGVVRLSVDGEPQPTADHLNQRSARQCAR